MKSNLSQKFICNPFKVTLKLPLARSFINRLAFELSLCFLFPPVLLHIFHVTLQSLRYVVEIVDIISRLTAAVPSIIQSLPTHVCQEYSTAVNALRSNQLVLQMAPINTVVRLTWHLTRTNSWSKDLIEKLTVSQLVKKFLDLY
jgi:Na+-transporting NADH:ubiquinone oxidoreductase subunit NqrB